MGKVTSYFGYNEAEINAIAERVLGRPLAELEAERAAARARLLANNRTLLAMHKHPWSDKAMRAFWKRYGFEGDDFVVVEEPSGTRGKTRVVWKLNPKKFKVRAKVYRLQRDE